MLPKNNIYNEGKGYFMLTLDDGSVYEVTGDVEDISLGVEAETAWGDDCKFYMPSIADTLTVRMRRDLGFNGSFHGLFSPKRIIHNGPALVVFWWDGTKTVVKCHDEDFDVEKGLAMALCRKLWGRCATERFVKMVEEQ